MFYKDILKVYGGNTEAFNQFLFWCISEDEKATFARARNDVPGKELYINLDEKEKQLAKKLIRERIEMCDDIFYIKLLGFCGDADDITLINKKLNVYNEKNKMTNSNFTYCIKICRETIKILNTNK